MKIKLLSLCLGCPPMLALLAVPAPAQTVLSDPAAIRSCLCEQQAVDALNGQVQQARQKYEEQRQSLQSLDQQVTAQRAALTANPGGDSGPFKALLDRRDETQRLLTNETTPAYGAAVNRYNAAVSRFNSECSGRIYEPGPEAAVRASNFTCPRP